MKGGSNREELDRREPRTGRPIRGENQTAWNKPAVPQGRVPASPAVHNRTTYLSDFAAGAAVVVLLDDSFLLEEESLELEDDSLELEAAPPFSDFPLCAGELCDFA